MTNPKKQLAPLFILTAGALWGTMGIFVRKLRTCIQPINDVK